MHPQEQGAFTSVFAGCAQRDDPNIFHGVYIVPPNVAFEQAKIALDQSKQEELFSFTKKLVEELRIDIPL